MALLDRTRRRRLAFALLLSAGLAGLAAFGLFPQEPGRAWVESRLRTLVGPGSSVGRLSIVPGRLAAEIDGLVLDSPAWRLEADHASVVLSRRTLFGEGTFVDRLVLTGARLVLRPARAGTASSEPPGPLVIRGLEVPAATLRYELPDGDITLEPIDLRGVFGDGVLEATAAGGAWERTPRVALGPVRLRLRSTPALDLELERLEAGLESTRVTLSGPLGRLGALHPRLNFDATADLAELNALAPTGFDAGRLTARGLLSGPPEALAVSADVATEALRSGPWTIDRAAAHLTRGADGDTRLTGTATALGGRARFDGRLRGRAVSGRVVASGLDLARLRRPLGLTTAATGTAGAAVAVDGALDGTVQVEARVDGAGTAGADHAFTVAAHATGPVRLSPLTLGLDWDSTVATASATSALRASALQARGTARGTLPPELAGHVEGTVDLATAHGPRTARLDADLRARGTRVGALDLRGDALELAALDPRLRGRAGFVLHAAGPLHGLSGEGTLDLPSLGWSEADLGPLRGTVTLRNGAADVSLALPALNVTTDARVDRDRRRLSGRFALQATPLAAAAAALPAGRGVEGTVTAAGTFDIPLATPAAGTVEAEVQALDVVRGDLSTRARQPFGVGLRGRRLAIRDLRLEGPGVTLEATGTVGLDARRALDLEVRAGAELGALPRSGSWSLGGSARAQVTLSGTPAHPLATGFVNLDGVEVASPGLPTAHIEGSSIALLGTDARIERLTATVAGGTIDVTGHVPLPALVKAARRQPGTVAPDEGADVHVSWSGVEAARLLEAVRPESAGTLQATLAGALSVEGGLTALGEMRGTLALPALTARAQDVDLGLAPLEVRLEGGRLATDGIELSAPGGVVKVAGSVDLLRRSLALAGHGTFDLRTLSPFVEAAALSGSAQLDLAVDGPLDAPRPHGTLSVRDGTLRFRLLPQAVTGLSADFSADGRAVTLARATADFAGGTLGASGTALLGGAGVNDARFALTGRGLALRYPEGMRSRLEADLTFTGRTGDFLLAGTVKALRGLYDLDTALAESLTAPAPATTPSPFMRSIGLDLRVVTEGPVLVRNNLARLQAGGRLAVRGDLETPAPIGSLDIEQGGKIYLQGREFTVDSGRLAYSGTWDPEMALEAGARIADVDHGSGLKRADAQVTVGLQGRMFSPQLTLRSDPAYSRLEIVNLIATGDSQNPNARLAVGGPAAALLAGRLTRGLRHLGFDEVSIQPELVAREGGVDTGARFTFGKRLAPRVNLVYSLSLQDPEARFVQVELAPARDVALNVRRTDSGSFSYGAGQRFHLGGEKRQREVSDQRLRLSGVRFTGDAPLEAAAAQEVVGLRAGERKSVWDLQDAADQLREHLVERGYLEAEVGARFEEQAAVFVVRSGARYRWTVEGLPAPPDLTSLMRRALFEEEALENGRARLLDDLRKRGHLRARVDTRTEVEGGARTLVFHVQPGPELQAVVTFPGAAALSEGRLLKAAGGAGTLLTDPVAALAAIAAAYRDAHFLQADAGPVQVDEAGGGLRVEVPVREGPRARLAAVHFEGATHPEADLARAAEMEVGSAYDEGAALAAADRLRAFYFERGYGAVRVGARLAPQGHDLALVFQVFEGERVTVAAVVLRGLGRTREGLVRRQVLLRPGDPLDPRRVAEMERRLLDLGVFTRAAATVSEDNPATVTVVLEEGDRLRTGYLFSHDDDTGSRAELDGELRGLLGAGLSVGGRLSFGADLRDTRGFVNLPSLLPTGRLTVSAFRLAEDLPLSAGDESAGTLERTQTGGQLQATRPLARSWDLLYGYRIKRTHIVSPFLTTTRWVAGVDVSVVSDTRDDPLDARAGRFLSLSLEIAPQALGSDFDFVKGFAQAFFSRPLHERWTWAHGYRLGLAHPFRGEPLVSDEGFEAGGANSVRGFASGSLGPPDFVFGRQAVVVVNQELRYHHPGGLGAAFFYDAGNTFASARDLSLHVRHVLGGGLRYASPVGLLRLDVGFPLGRREGESAAKLFFSFGQAF
jgi:outer membrane protein insertion porin family